MVITFVTSSSSQGKSSGTTIGSGSLTFSAGDTIFAFFAFDNLTASTPFVTSIGRPAGETNTWALVSSFNSPQAAAAGGVRGELWRLDTTVGATGAQFTTILSAAVTAKVALYQVFSGAGQVSPVFSTNGTGTAYTTTEGQMFLAFNATEDAAREFYTGFTNEVQAVNLGTTGGSSATNVWANGSHRVMTGGGALTIACTPVDGGMIVAIVSPIPTITQAAYRFYADGSEAGSVALAAQDTAPSVDLIAGDVPIQLRVRLQEGNTGSGSAADDYALQWERNGDGTWTGVSGALLATYPVANETAGTGIGLGNTATTVGTNVVGNGKPLTRIGFRVYHASNVPNGTMDAVLYASDSAITVAAAKPTGSILATSTTSYPMSAVTTSPQWFYFDFDGTTTLTAGTTYYVMVRTTNTVSSSALVTIDSSPSYVGNYAWGTPPNFFSAFTSDLIFEAYVVSPTVTPYDSPNLDSTAVTTQRLTGAATLFESGDITEDGVANDYLLARNRHTELLYGFQLIAADLADGDTLRFRVRRNDAALDTYTVVPTLTASKVSGPVTWQASGTTPIVTTTSGDATRTPLTFEASGTIDVVSGTSGVLGIRLENNFETGLPDGTAITTANSDDGTPSAGAPHATVVITGGPITYSTLAPRGGTLNGRLAASTASNIYIRSATTPLLGSLTTASRAYFLIESPNTMTGNNVIFRSLNGANSAMMQFRVTSTLVPQFLNGAGTPIGTTGAALSLDTWYRIETWATPGTTTTTGRASIDLYQGDSLTSLLHYDTVAGHAGTLQSPRGFDIGRNSPVAGAYTLRVDDFATDSIIGEAYIGPVPTVPQVYDASGTVEILSAAVGDATVITAPVTYPVAGTVPIISGSSGAVTLRQSVTGVVPIVSVSTGAATMKGAAAGIVPATSTVVGAATVRAVGAGVVPIVSTTAGSVTATMTGAAGVIPIVTTATGDATLVVGSVTWQATGVVPVVSVAVGMATARAVATGVVAVISTTTGTVTARHVAAAAVPVVTTVAGAVTARHALAGVVPITSTGAGAVTATLTTTAATPILTGVAGDATVVIGSVTHQASGLIPVVTASTGTVTARHVAAAVVSVVTAATGALAVRAAGAGVVGIVTTAAATARVGHAASSVAPILSTVAGAVTARGQVAGVVPIITTSTGSTLLPGAQATVPIVTTVTGAVTVKQNVTGTVAIVSIVAGGVTARHVAASVTPILSTTSGVVRQNAAAVGVVPILSTASGTLTATQRVSGTVPILTAASGNATPTDTTTGTVSILSTVAGAVSAVLPASGVVQIISSASATARVGMSAAGTVPIISTVAGSLSGVFRRASGVVVITSAASGLIRQRHVTSGRVPILSSLAGQVVSRQSAMGTIVIVSATSGSIVLIGAPGAGGFPDYPLTLTPDAPVLDLVGSGTVLTLTGAVEERVLTLDGTAHTLTLAGASEILMMEAIT
jgi:hypothetical protein